MTFMSSPSMTAICHGYITILQQKCKRNSCVCFWYKNGTLQHKNRLKEIPVLCIFFFPNPFSFHPHLRVKSRGPMLTVLSWGLEKMLLFHRQSLAGIRKPWIKVVPSIPATDPQRTSREIESKCSGIFITT